MRNGCRAGNWDTVYTAGDDDIDPQRFRNVTFSGDIQLGTFGCTRTLGSGISVPCGIYDARLHNVTIGNECLIMGIHNHIANYRIGDNTEIINSGLIATDGESTFGNGTEITVINEGGGREVPMYETLSAQVAYLIALYRHRRKMIRNLGEIIASYSDRKRSSMGHIGRNVRIHNSSIIQNVRIDDDARIEGVGELYDGTVRSCSEDPAYIGTNVIAKHFIICEGAEVSDNTILDHCFVGQGAELSKQYSAENSLFFANCGGFHGEACSVFAGPYTVTHHKSTLLIACLVSFLNAGSGSNQSNHMYKLGPNHQGIIDRGSKTASDSYMLWPMRVGAFTLIMGRHYNNSDTTEFPFSYLIEHDGESLLIPAVNLRSIGTIRDSRKWPRRDTRKGPDQFDLINFNLLSPYTVRQILNGIGKLREIELMSGHSSQTYYYNGVKIRRSALENGISLYQKAVDRYLGNIVVNYLATQSFDTFGELIALLTPENSSGRGDWIDVAGMIAPWEEIESIIESIESGELATIPEIDAAFRTVHENFTEYELVWGVNCIEEEYGKPIDAFLPDDFITLVERWLKAVEELYRLRYQDASKEYAETAKVGYALNNGSRERDEEYLVINGEIEQNDFIREIRARMEMKQKAGRKLITALESFR